MRHLFGTDGIRGVAGEYPLDRRTTRLIGRALGHYLSSKTRNPSVVIGEDTRESSSAIAAVVAAGLESAGVRVESAGVITTPGIAFLARKHGFHAGVVISASHNPWQDNGIKVFGHDGYKLPDDVELEIEKEIFSQLAGNAASEPLASKPLRASIQLHLHYVKWLQSSVDTAKLGRLGVVVDSDNGAASAIAPEVFRACGVQATFVSNQPDGRNINQQCGALHPEAVARAVRELHADVGITLDGDADRALFSDAAGNVINGDAVMLLAAREMKARGSLANDTVVATTMSNMGLEAALRRSGIRMLRAPVGDKYVLEEMRKTGVTLGGEQSGHIIFRDGDATTGDGLLTALRVLEIVGRSGKPLAELVGDLKVFPQVIKNVRVREKTPFVQVPQIQRAIAEAEGSLNGNGR